MDFQTTSYTSPLLWHFVRGAGNECLSAFLKALPEQPIFNDDASGVLLSIPPSRKPYHSRNFVLENNASEYINSSESSQSSDLASQRSYLLKEPRSICFADIPISHLPIHINRYYGIGLGFRKDRLIMANAELRPVEYFPRNNLFALKNACESFDDTILDEQNLKRYSKVPTEDETFYEIYHEREWRTFDRFEFSSDELSIIFFPTRDLLNQALQKTRFQNFFQRGVGYICGEDLYESKKGNI